MNITKGLTNLCIQIAEIYDMSPEDMTGGSRKKRITDAKHVFSVIAKHRGYNYKQIGRFLNMDHSTIQYYCKDRPTTEKATKVITAFTDTSTLIRETAKRLAEDPDNKYLRIQILRLITSEF